MDKYDQFLKNLHDEGDINIFDAVKPLMEKFGLTQDEAYTILEDWIKSNII